jgi:hypothetical protein
MRHKAKEFPMYTPSRSMRLMKLNYVTWTNQKKLRANDKLPRNYGAGMSLGTHQIPPKVALYTFALTNKHKAS